MARESNLEDQGNMREGFRRNRFEGGKCCLLGPAEIYLRTARCLRLERMRKWSTSRDIGCWTCSGRRRKMETRGHAATLRRKAA